MSVIIDSHARKFARTAFCSSVALAALVMASAPAFADANTAAGASASSEGDIIVTARRTEEKLQDVPVAVAAFGGEALAEHRIASETDLQMATPGLTVRQTSSSNQLNFAIRGQSIDSFSYTAPAVLAYFNEVQTGGTTATSFFDLESIQVLKGPQGTLFGRNATGGAVLYSSKKPTSEFGGYIKGGFGNYDNSELEAALNLPLTEGIAVRFAGKSQDRDGFQRNLYNDTDLNSINSRVGRITLLIAPTGSGLENVTVFQYGKFGGNSGGLKMQNANGVNGFPATYIHPITGAVTPLTTNFRDAYPEGTVTTNPRVTELGFTGIGDYLTKQASIGFYDVYNDRTNSHRARQYMGSNTTTFEVSDTMRIKNIAGFNDVLSLDQTDVDGSPYQWLTIGGGTAPEDQGYTYGTKQISDELQMSGKSGALTYIVGAFISREKQYNRIPLAVTPDLGQPFIGAYDFTTTDISKAVFAQLSYALTDRLNLTGGVRYTWEDFKIVQNSTSLLYTGTLGLFNGHRKDSKPSWLVGIDYKVTEDLMVYFNQRGSWRAGGFNGTSTTLDNGAADTFEPETTYDFEFGMKYAGRLGSMPTHANLAIYDQYISDVQRSPYIGISAVGGNVNKARVYGFELDGSIDVTDWLQLGGAFSYTNAKYTDNVAVVASNTFYFGPYADAPKTAGSAYFRVKQDFGDAGTVVFRGDFYGQAHTFYSNLNNTSSPGTMIDGYHLLNARLEWNDIKGSPVSVAAYVQNITKEKYEVGGIALSGVTGSNATLPGTPQMYGFEIAVKF